MSPFTIFLIIIVVLAAVLGFRKGLVRQIGSLAGLVIAIAVCRIYGSDVAAWFTSGVESASNVALYTILAYVCLLLVAYFAVFFLARLFRSVICALRLGIVDRIGGAMFKVLFWLFAASLFYNMFVAVVPDSQPAPQELWKQRLLTLAPVVIGSETAAELWHTVGHAVTGK